MTAPAHGLESGYEGGDDCAPRKGRFELLCLFGPLLVLVLGLLLVKIQPGLTFLRALSCWRSLAADASSIWVLAYICLNSSTEFSDSLRR